MTERCIDASVVLKLVFKGESHRSTARRLLRDSIANDDILIAPAFFESEVDSAVRKRVFEGAMTVAEAKRAYKGLDDVEVEIVSHARMRTRAREIAQQYNQRSVYDSVYAALAELRGCDLWTADKKFYDAVKGKLKFVKFLPDYP
jgi:predicted nucleic acid-binding protein